MVFARHSSIDGARQFMEPSTSVISITLTWHSTCFFASKQMLRVRRTANGDVVFTLSGRIDNEHIVELEAVIAAESEDRRIILDLKDMTLTGQDGILFLARCESDGIALANCDPYIREWITTLGTGR
jgi:hypothetical protein